MTWTLRPARIALAAALGIALSACGSQPSASLSATPGAGATSSLVPAEEGTPGPSDTAGPVPSVASPVQGVVLHVDLAGLGKVTGFRLLTRDGQQVDFKMGVQENAAQFPAAHLSEHMASSEPVLVSFRPEGSDLVVYRLDDATPSTPPSGSGTSPSPASS